jgi:hypothetical protein
MTTAKPAPVTVDLHTALGAMRLEHLQCRDFGHAWRPYAAQWLTTERCYESRLRCSRCRTQRVRLIGQNGALVSSHYEYADNYLVKGLGRLDTSDRNELRLASLQHVLPAETDEEAG